MAPDAAPPALEKEDIQSPILRRRPAPYAGCHVLLHFADGGQAREFVRRLVPHIISAADYASADTWAAIAFTYTGLQALGVPQTSLDSFPAAFREGMAARAASFEESEDSLPKHWEEPYGTGRIHAVLTLLSISDSTFQEKLALARKELQDLPAVQVLKREDFAQYHAVLAWAAEQGLRVAPHVTLYLQFGTEDVREHCIRQGWLAAFEAVGAQILQPACGACANCGPGASTSADQVTVSAINRNFPGRSGPGQVWLASPATVAASAIAGTLTSFEELAGR